MSLFHLPSTAGECNDIFDEDYGHTKKFMLQHLYGQCCKPGSKPNGICGTKITLPCDQASDFHGTKIIDEHDQSTCSQIIPFLPHSAKECSEKVFDGPETKGGTLKYMHSMCCKPGSKPNDICGFKLSTATPCENKADGEFMPEAT